MSLQIKCMQHIYIYILDGNWLKYNKFINKVSKSNTLIIYD